MRHFNLDYRSQCLSRVTSVISVVKTNGSIDSIAQCYTCEHDHNSTVTSLIWLTLRATVAHAAPPIELELATERGVQITAPQQWLQLLAGIGIKQVQIRGLRPGDAPRVENTGTAERPAYHVVGVLTSRDQLQLPGGTFTMADRAKLKDFFARLSADGAEVARPRRAVGSA